MSISPNIKHFSHEHPLTLKNDDVIARGALCYVCDRTIIDSVTYICPRRDIDDGCENYYLHKSCAELPKHINHYKHNKHDLALILRPYCICDVCGRTVKSLAYTCEKCDLDVCIICSFEQRVLSHPGHEEHPLTLMPREALFECDACRRESKDSSYVCTTCDFWIHRECAMEPLILYTSHHPHPVILAYSIPPEHRDFTRFCSICHYHVTINNWMYYCRPCRSFMHMRCATNIKSRGPDVHDTTALVQFPLPSEEALFELIIGNCGQFQVDFQSNGENNITVPTIYNDQHIIEEHWSHNHPLEKFQYTNCSENDNEDNSDDSRVMICDGCIQPITTSHPSYYACVQCAFFLHSICATKLPKELPVEACTFHPKHPLFLKRDRFYSFVKCGVCSFSTNGFYYHCEICDIKVDIRCAFLPRRVKHNLHKEHFLDQCPSDNSNCSASNLLIREGMEYACMTCTDFQIHTLCAFYPRRINHKCDLHPLTLRNPPFFYEGIFYCEICEEKVDNQSWLYRCDECDRGFHCDCVRQYENVKLGGTIKLRLNDENHTLALVLKRPQRKNSPLYICCYCKHEYKYEFFFECDGCGFLACCKCVDEILRDRVTSQFSFEIHPQCL